MTDIRTRLADALREQLLTPEHLWDWQQVDPAMFDDVVEALLSLRGIAIVDAEDLWDAQQCVQDWRDSDNCDDTPAHRRRLTRLARRLRDAANAAEAGHG